MEARTSYADEDISMPYTPLDEKHASLFGVDRSKYKHDIDYIMACNAALADFFKIPWRPIQASFLGHNPIEKSEEEMVAWMRCMALFEYGIDISRRDSKKICKNLLHPKGRLVLPEIFFDSRYLEFEPEGSVPLYLAKVKVDFNPW